MWARNSGAQSLKYVCLYVGHAAVYVQYRLMMLAARELSK